MLQHHMANWNFLKKTEFWVTLGITVLLTFVGGLLSGKYYYYGDYNEIKQKYEIFDSSIQESVINSPGASWKKEDKSTTIVTQGPITVQGPLSIGLGGLLHVEENPSSIIFKQLGVYHEHNLVYRNVLVKTPSDKEAFIKFFPPFTWIYIGICKQDYSDCKIFSKFLNIENTTPCNLLNLSAGGNQSEIVSLKC